MIDTSVMLAALLAQHEFHDLARPHLHLDRPVPAITLAETYAQLRRTAALRADDAIEAVRPWAFDAELIAALPSAGHEWVFRQARSLDLAGNIHDALIAATCMRHDMPLATLDRRQHTIARALGADSTCLTD